MILLTSCIYEPISKGITFFNNSDSAIYVYVSCEDSIDAHQPLKLFGKFPDKSFDEQGIKNPKFYSPDYRINAYSYGQLLGFGNKKENFIPCKSDSLYIFFIKENILKNYKWAIIVEKKLFSNREIYTRHMLDSLYWKIQFNP